MDAVSDKEILNYALSNGIIDITHIQQQIEMNEREKYLKMHENKVWQASDGKWKTHLPDNMACDGRRMIKAKDRKALDDKIIKHYKALENEPYIDMVFNEWNNQRLSYGEIEKQTYDRYQTDFKRFFNDSKIIKTKFRYIDEDMLEDFIKSTIRDKKLTAKAWGNLRILIRGIFKYAKKKGYTQISITEFLGDLDLSNRAFEKRYFADEEQVFTDKEIDMIVDYINNEPISILNLGIILAFQVGLRRGELSTLKYSDIKDDRLKKIGMDADEFKKLAFELYKSIQEEWMNFDYEGLRKHLTDELYNSYVMQLDALKVKGQQNIMKDFANIDVKITNITEESGIVNVTVYLHTAMYDYVVDNNKKTVRGKDNHKIDIEYSITFVKASDESKQKCPNCGAPFEGVAGGKCEYCGSTTVIGPKEYVMSKKTCIGQRMR